MRQPSLEGRALGSFSLAFLSSLPLPRPGGFIICYFHTHITQDPPPPSFHNYEDATLYFLKFTWGTYEIQWVPFAVRFPCPQLDEAALLVLIHLILSFFPQRIRRTSWDNPQELKVKGIPSSPSALGDSRNDLSCPWENAYVPSWRSPTLFSGSWQLSPLLLCWQVSSRLCLSACQSKAGFNEEPLFQPLLRLRVQTWVT